MNDLDPLWLRSFIAIARAGSITRAALQVHRTQSAVSTHLQQLEASLDARLVHRTTRSLTLTEAGQRLLPHAARLIELQSEAQAAVVAPREQALWRIGISEYFLPARLGELLAVLRKAAPGVRLELLWASSASLQALWSQGQVDLAVVTTAKPLAGARLLRREPLSWVMAAGPAPAAGAPLPLVLLGPDCPVRQLALAALARAGRAHHIQLSCSGSHGAIAAIRAGWGVGCLNRSAIPPDLATLSARQGARAWPSAGHLSFHVLAKPACEPALKALRHWSAG